MGYLLAINPTYTPEDERRKEPTAITHLERKEKSSEPNLQKKLCEPAVNPPDKVKDQAFPVGFVLDAQPVYDLEFQLFTDKNQRDNFSAAVFFKADGSIQRFKSSQTLTPWKLNIAPKNIPSQRRVVFQPSFFRGYVKLWEGNYPFLKNIMTNQRRVKLVHFNNTGHSNRVSSGLIKFINLKPVF